MKTISDLMKVDTHLDIRIICQNMRLMFYSGSWKVVEWSRRGLPTILLDTEDEAAAVKLFAEKIGLEG